MNMRTTISIPPLLLLLAIFYVYGGNAAVFTVRNNCKFKIWPAGLFGIGSSVPTGFVLSPKAQKRVTILPPWLGRFWARYQCSNKSGKFTCLSGDCASGQIECNGAGAIPPASLAEFTLAGANCLDFYDVSLVDGFNLPVSIHPTKSNCPTTSCPTNVNRACPNELAVKGPHGTVVGCKSACVALNQPQYCCSGAYASPSTCSPTSYSQIFKTRCPQAYSYAFDDKTSTFTCPTGGDYVITFCP